ncbi:hypothetical protein PAPHI01_1736 [Pancytospora philotis]|nr:hypothetical protein PAPHI01_1736 [Pancytospora philotis]
MFSQLLLMTVRCAPTATERLYEHMPTTPSINQHELKHMKEKHAEYHTLLVKTAEECTGTLMAMYSVIEEQTVSLVSCIDKAKIKYSDYGFAVCIEFLKAKDAYIGFQQQAIGAMHVKSESLPARIHEMCTMLYELADLSVNQACAAGLMLNPTIDQPLSPEEFRRRQCAAQISNCTEYIQHISNQLGCFDRSVEYVRYKSLTEGHQLLLRGYSAKMVKYARIILNITYVARDMRIKVGRAAGLLNSCRTLADTLRGCNGENAETLERLYKATMVSFEVLCTQMKDNHRLYSGEFDSFLGECTALIKELKRAEACPSLAIVLPYQNQVQAANIDGAAQDTQESHRIDPVYANMLYDLTNTT